MDSKLFTSLLKDMSELYPDSTLKDVSDYFDLCDKVSEIDEDAAWYLRYHAWRDKNILFNFTDTLGNSFVWNRTDHGGAYWVDIDEKLTYVA